MDKVRVLKENKTQGYEEKVEGRKTAKGFLRKDEHPTKISLD